MTRYLIFGAGAVGTLLGGLLAKAGHSVAFIGREWNMEGIRKKGIRISGVWGDHDIPPQSAYEAVDDIPSDQREFDQVIITVKAFNTEKAIQSCLPVIHDASLVISCQNGFGNSQIIADRIGWRRTLGARFITGVEITEPGVIQVTVHADSVRLGHYQRDFPMDQIESIAQTLRDAGIPTEATDQLEQYVWAKILYNAALNPLGALLGVTYGELADNQDARSIMNRILEEAFAVTGKCGIEQFWPNADAYKDAFYNQMLPPTAAHFPSMLRDLERGRQTEINALNGAISQLGEKAKIPTSVNDTIASLIHFREKQQNT